MPNLLSGPSAPALAVASGLERARRVTAMARKGERHLGLAPTTILLGLLSTSVGGFGTDNDDLEWVRTNAITENGGGVTLNDTLPDCACKHQWFHNEYLCNLNNSRVNHGWVMMLGCPTLDTLGLCEDSPSQSWCETTDVTCKQQVGDHAGKGWSYCSPETQLPELPRCTCKSSWQIDSGLCGSRPVTIEGCPTIDQMQRCYPDYDGQMRCDTNEDLCLEQEDEIRYDGERMVGMGWAYCDPVYGEPELPVCECEDEWNATASDCRDGETKTFHGCPSISLIEDCLSNHMIDGGDQTWCSTKRQRCREQTVSKSVTDDVMVNASWAYCSPDTGEPELPACECVGDWNHTEGRCSINPMEMEGCPNLEALRRCDGSASQSWCETTFTKCREQGHELFGRGRASCEPEGGMAELSDCECEESWQYTAGNCYGETSHIMRGCPTLDELAVCEPGLESSWCETTDALCKGQHGDEVGSGWVTCDPYSQRAVTEGAGGSDGPDGTNTAAIIAASVGVTLIVVATTTILVLTYHKHGGKQLNPRGRGGYRDQSSNSAKLMDHGDSYSTPPRGMFGGRNK